MSLKKTQKLLKLPCLMLALGGSEITTTVVLILMEKAHLRAMKILIPL